MKNDGKYDMDDPMDFHTEKTWVLMDLDLFKSIHMEKP